MNARRRRSQSAPRVVDTVAAYVRVSTEEQVASGAGLEVQRNAITAECERRGWTITSWHADEGISGGKDINRRPALAAALDAIDNGTAILMVSKSDRLARSLQTLLTVLDRTERAGGMVVSVDNTIDTSTAAGRFTTQVMGGVAELERALISDRTKAALAVKKAHGVRLGRPITVPDAIAERIARERDGGATWQAICDRLNNEGVPTGQGGAWWPATAQRIAIRYQREACEQEAS